MATKKSTRKKMADKQATAVADPREPIAITPKALQATLKEVRAVLEQTPPPETPASGDLVRAMLHIFLADGLPCGYGQEALRRIDGAFVDRNEFRVTEAFEVAELFDDMQIPDLFDRCMSVRNAIAEVYNDQNSVSLDALREAAVSDRSQFFQRVPSITPAVQRFVVGVLSFEECVFSDRSTLRVQTRLGFDPKAAATKSFFDELRAMLAPYGHVPLIVGPDSADGKPIKKPELSPASLLVRLAPPKLK